MSSNHHQVPAYSEDFAGACDSEVDVLAEKLGCSRGLAGRVMKWHREEVTKGGASAGDVGLLVCQAMQDLVVMLLKPQRSMAAWVWALIFAAGLDSTNGVRSMAEVARKLKVTRALLSHYAQEWTDALPWLENFKFLRSRETVERCRKARVRVFQASRRG